MALATITIFCNESFRIPKWQEYYKEYKDSVSLHIIVDNNSEEAETNLLRQAFPESKHIKLSYNGGVTAAYNAGVNIALLDQTIDAIMLICNDIKISASSIQEMYRALDNETKIGMVTPVLLKKDSDVIEDGGSTISFFLFMKPKHVGKKYITLPEESFFVKSVTGGINLASREFYETIGDQDELLFMYSDEIDVGIKAKKAGYSMMMIRNAKAWHQHENPPGKKRRSVMSDYLMARNKVYLAKKYFGTFRMLLTFCYFVFYNGKRIIICKIKKRETLSHRFALKGALDALCGKMGMPEFIK